MNGFLGQPFAQRQDEPRLADARLAAEENHLPFASRRPLPAVEQQGQLGRATDERFRSLTVKRLEPAFGLTRPEHAEEHAVDDGIRT